MGCITNVLILQVDPEPFFESCYYDACGCNTGGDCECMCTAIAAYSRECNRHGIHIKWRTQELCRELKILTHCKKLKFILILAAIRFL